MPMTYTIARIFTSEEARFQGRPLSTAVLEYINKQKISARCHITKGVAGCYENGEIATHGIEVLSFNLPLEIIIIFPQAESERILPRLEAMVEEGLMTVEEKEVHWHKCRKRTIPRQVRVRDIMTPAPRTLTIGAPAGNALHILMEAEFHGIPVVDSQGRPVGMVTHGDLLRHPELPIKVGMLRKLDPDHLGAVEAALAGKSVEEFMNKPVVTVPEDALVAKAVDLMLAKDVKRLPTVDAEGRIAGMLSRLDIFKTIMDKMPDWMQGEWPGIQLEGVAFARDAMRTDTPKLPPTAPVWDAIQKIETTSIRRVAIVDEAGKLLGLISDKILVGAFSEHKGGLKDFLLHKLPFAAMEAKDPGIRNLFRSQTVGEIMRTDIISVQEDDPIEEALRRMIQNKLKRIPVLDAQGRFKGMLTRDSLLRAGSAP